MNWISLRTSAIETPLREKQTSQWEKKPAVHLSNKGLLSRTHKEFHKLIGKGKYNPKKGGGAKT